MFSLRYLGDVRSSALEDGHSALQIFCPAEQQRQGSLPALLHPGGLELHQTLNCCTQARDTAVKWALVSTLLGVQAVLPWHRLLTLQLTGEVHFLGPVLSCQALLRNDTGQRRTNPYVPSHVVVMDQVPPTRCATLSLMCGY